MSSFSSSCINMPTLPVIFTGRRHYEFASCMCLFLNISVLLETQFM